MKPIVRILKMELSNFKNIEQGTIEMPSLLLKKYFNNESDLLGIYGQNGSGKTAVIEAMKIIQTLFLGNSLPADTINYINIGSSGFKIKTRFSIEADNNKFIIDYLAEINKTDNETFSISKEKIDYSKMEKEKFTTKKTLIEHSPTNEIPVLPQTQYKKLAPTVPDQIDVKVISKIAFRDNCSFIFNFHSNKLFEPESNKDFYIIINSLFSFAKENLFVITDSRNAVISLNIMPVPFTEQTLDKNNFSIPIKNPVTTGEKQYKVLCKIIPQMNIILKKIIPGMTIGIKDYGKELNNEGQLVYRIEFVSIRENKEIPLRFESNGIIKLISILNILLCLYHNPAICLFIDELDSGIFEYLLGELGSILQDEAKGQIVFTSHNLRILETLNKNNVIFTTTNPKNRFIRLTGLKSTNNLRDYYYRALSLEGQKEKLYDQTSNSDIVFAFMQAAKEDSNGKD